MANLSSLAGGFAALADRNFAWYMAGNAISLAGFWVHKVAAGWLTWELTHSGTWLGLIAFADLFPTLIFAPIAGVVADRVDRRRIALVSQVFAMVQAFTLAALVITGLIDVWSLLALTLALGIIYSFNTSARLAMLPNIVERRHVSSAIALNASLFNVARFVGPAIAGWLIAGWGVGLAFLFNGFAFVAFIVTLLRTRQIRHEQGGRGQGGLLRQSTEGLRYASAHPGIGPMLVLLTAMAVGVKCVLELLPGFADAVFARGAPGLAQLTSAAGAGALVAALWLVMRTHAVGLTAITIASLGVGGASVLGFALSDAYVVGLAASFMIGVTITLSGTGTQTLMQNVVDGAMRGRVMSLYGVIYRGAPAVGALAMGGASEMIGLQAAVGGGAGVAGLAWLWLMRRRARTAAALELEPG